MAGISEQSFDPKLTVVVLNIPSNVGDEDITIHFQKAKHGGGDVGDVVVDESVAFVTFDLPEVATSVLNHEQIMIQIQSHESWLANKKDNTAIDNKDDSRTIDKADGITTIYVSGIKDSTTEDAITFFFENKKRTGGGDLREDTEGCKKVAPTVARLTFVSSKDAQNVLEKAKEKPLRLEGNLLKVSTVFEPTHDRSILLAKNLNPQTNKETFGNFVEFKRNADVRNVVFGKDGKAIVILNSEIGEDYSDEESSNEDMELNGSIISLEFAPLTKRIKVSNIPPGTSKDDVRYKFSSRKIGGGQVTNVELNEENGVANVYFGKSSVVSALVQKEHTFQGVPLTVIPHYDNFEELQEITTKTTEFSGNYHIEALVMDNIINHQEIERNFNFKSMRYDKGTSQIHFTKDFDDPKLAGDFENKFKEFLCEFVKEEVKIPKSVFGKVKEAIESKREEFGAEKLDFSFDVYRVTFVGKKEDVIRQKQAAEAMIDTIFEEAKFESTELVIGDQNKLKFLNFIDYFKKLLIEFPGMKTHGMESTSGKITLFGTAGKAKDLKLRILEDLVKISEIEVKLSDRQIGFLKRTDCQIVNDVLKDDDVMLMLISITRVVGAKSLQAKIFSLKKCNDNKKKWLLNIAHAKTSEKCINVDEETASFLKKSDKLQEFKKEQFEKHQVLIDPELANPRNIWIVCEKSKMNNAEQELTSLTDEKKIASSTFKPTDPMKIRFLKEHCWDKIKEKETNCKAEGVVVTEIDSDSLEVKGTQTGRKEVVTFLENLAKKVEFKEKTMPDDVIKKFTDGHFEKLRKLERDYNVKIKTDQSKANVKIKGHVADIANVQEEIRIILKEITEKESNVPETWDSSLTGGVVHKVKLSTRSKEYKDVETAFRKTAPNQIVCIERIQNREIYELYNVKRQAMMKKYGSNFTGKELMLFHGTSRENVDKINSGGLNRSYAGLHATLYGRGVSFARDASYSCSTTYSPPDPQGLRYTYYAKVLIGDYTLGNRSMIVPPNKNTGDVNETYDSVVDNTANPNIYVMFQDYEYYTEYLITFR